MFLIFVLNNAVSGPIVKQILREVGLMADTSQERKVTGSEKGLGLSLL